MKYDYDKIIDMYQNGRSLTDIVNECGCCYGTIYHTLKRFNIDKRGGCVKVLPSDLRDEIISRYKNNESIYSITKALKVTCDCVKKVLDTENVVTISPCKRFNHDMKEDFFEKIDTPSKAYWLGWLITDGCISKGYTISMSLQERDLEILERFQNDLGLSGKIKIFNKKYYRLSFCCKKMVEDLSKYGVVKNKTFTVTIPDVNDELLPHLLRGCFEGDGGISKTLRKKYNRYEYEIGFTGNIECVNRFNILVSKLTGIAPKNIVKNNSICRVRWSSITEMYNILDKFYGDCGEHKLNRKYKLFEEIKNL